MGFVYLLRCADGSLYCGWTLDLARRVAAHEAGRASKYTASRRPVRLAAAWESDAPRKLEHAIKALTRAQKERLLSGEPLPLGLPLGESVQVG